MTRILINAEPFGFGPSAAAFEIFNIIKKEFPSIYLGYLGEGHDLDLQRKLPYDSFIVNAPGDTLETFDGFDIFITAMDRNKAKQAKMAGLTVIFYDALSWFWSDFSHFEYIDYYIYQAFFNKSKFPERSGPDLIEIAPLSLDFSNADKNRPKANYALINFGGLQNFYWDDTETFAYVDLILKNIYPLLAQHFKEIIVIGNSKIATEFSSFSIKTVTPFEAKSLTNNASFVLSTPGLGNIYDLANANTSCLFLPPANDSQGQQLDTLKQQNIIKHSLDWSQLGRPINYYEEQNKVMDSIKRNILSENSLPLADLTSHLLTNNPKELVLNDFFACFEHLRYNTLNTVLKNLLKNLLKDD